jgi:hypothetical protein
MATRQVVGGLAPAIATELAPLGIRRASPWLYSVPVLRCQLLPLHRGGSCVVLLRSIAAGCCQADIVRPWPWARHGAPALFVGLYFMLVALISGAAQVVGLTASGGGGFRESSLALLSTRALRGSRRTASSGSGGGSGSELAAGMLRPKHEGA